ncbi:arabinan endo-1,5-alpha-L-arabinosidase [Cellulomonas timonensis]|uniref:arabinan endo-1,5-alpha-L-arabinosidase n=1 Tax=Cellulomonas timonensis TaxID=1689271 RepID=UPI000830F9D8|nr:arabinan endo-1,5-alpha-L-arabinosidase [Cellulomonas timonensis]
MTSIDDPADVGGWGARHAHDPTAVRDADGTHYLFSTDAYADGPVRAGVQVRRSRDLVDWEFHGWALPGVPEAGAAWSGAGGLWAPEVVRVGDEWRMYWSASTFGSRTSAIGLAVAPSPTGPWADRGLVVTSLHDVDGPNAIDANAVADADGRHWLVYGSFFGGIHVIELDPATGLAVGGEPADGHRPGTCLARRPRAVEGAVEGAFVLPRPGGGHAMLISYDSLFSTYHLRVGVAERVTGPYRDHAGRPLTDDDADPAILLASHALTGGRTWLAPGHASVLTTPSPVGGADLQLLVHHVRDGAHPHQHEAQVRRLLWTHGRWPVVSPQPWAGDRETHELAPDARTLLGVWEVVSFDGPTAEVARPRTVRVGEDDLRDVVQHGPGRFTWQRESAALDTVAFMSWDAVRERAAWSFSGLTADGRAAFGTRVTDA